MQVISEKQTVYTIVLNTEERERLIEILEDATVSPECQKVRCDLQDMLNKPMER